MSIEIKQVHKLSQQLVMTPQLQQAIKLLQLSRMELVDLVREEMMENPILEAGEVTAQELDGSDGVEPVISTKSRWRGPPQLRKEKLALDFRRILEPIFEPQKSLLELRDCDFTPHRT